MATQFAIFKEMSLPASLKPNSIYVVPSATSSNHVDVYITNNTGSAARRVPTHSDIATMIASELAGFTSITIVNNITERNNLAPQKAIFVLVVDATGDPTVTSGSASYVFDPATNAWVKISEYESLDIVLSWENIANRPNSTVADIDDAVAKRHTHANKAVLDKITETDGVLAYQGMDPIVTWGSVAW